MNDGPMDLSVTQHAGVSGIRRVVDLANTRDDRRQNVQIFFDLIGIHDAPPPALLDGFVIGVIFYAMRLGQDIRVRGAMSQDCLRNLNEFQEAWHCWKPDMYTRVRIVPDRMDAQPAREDAAITAFSGGIDSIFTTLRHSRAMLGAASYPVRKAVLMVHGFDVPLRKPAQLEALKARTAPFCEDLGLETRVISTNLKELGLQDWVDSHGAQLAACLHNLAHEFSHGLIGSTEPYSALVLPWGSNPATDHLLSGSGIRIVHDAAGYTRTQKVELVAQHPLAMQVAKVCWEGRDTFRNCGECEKCIRTQLNFKAVGIAHAPCFEHPLWLQQIKRMQLLHHLHCAELKSIAAYADAKGLRADWLDVMKARIRRFEHPGLLRRLAGTGKLAKLLALIARGDWRRIHTRITGAARGFRARARPSRKPVPGILPTDTK